MIAHRTTAATASGHEPKGFRRLVVPTDLGPASIHSVDAAIVLAKQLDAELVLLHVFHIPPVAYAPGMYIPRDELRDGAQQALGLALSRIRDRHPKVTSELVEGEPWQEILAAASRCGADLIVMGTSAREGVARFFFGSVAEKVLHASPVPVMILAPPAAAPPG